MHEMQSSGWPSPKGWYKFFEGVVSLFSYPSCSCLSFEDCSDDDCDDNRHVLSMHKCIHLRACTKALGDTGSTN